MCLPVTILLRQQECIKTKAILQSVSIHINVALVQKFFKCCTAPGLVTEHVSHSANCIMLTINHRFQILIALNKKFTEISSLISVQYKHKLLGHKLKMCASVLCWHNSANAGIQVCFSIFMLSNRDWHEKLGGDFLLTRPWHENQVKQCPNGSIDFPHTESNLHEENTFHKRASHVPPSYCFNSISCTEKTGPQLPI